eukprot:296530-Chlamydomonas_euryale.AAC.4
MRCLAAAARQSPSHAAVPQTPSEAYAMVALRVLPGCGGARVRARCAAMRATCAAMHIPPAPPHAMRPAHTPQRRSRCVARLTPKRPRRGVCGCLQGCQRSTLPGQAHNTQCGVLDGRAQGREDGAKVLPQAAADTPVRLAASAARFRRGTTLCSVLNLLHCSAEEFSARWAASVCACVGRGGAQWRAASSWRAIPPMAEGWQAVLLLQMRALTTAVSGARAGANLRLRIAASAPRQRPATGWARPRRSSAHETHAGVGFGALSHRSSM